MSSVADYADRGGGNALLLDRIIGVVGRIYSVLAAFGAAWIFALMLLIVADVVGRNILAAPIIGVAEIAARSVVAIVFLLLPAAALRGTFIQADLLLRHVRNRGPRIAHLIEGIFAGAGTAVFVAIAIASWPDTAASLASGEFFGVQGIWTLPTFPFRLIVVAGSGFAAFGFLLVALRELRATFVGRA